MYGWGRVVAVVFVIAAVLLAAGLLAMLDKDGEDGGDTILPSVESTKPLPPSTVSSLPDGLVLSYEDCASRDRLMAYSPNSTLQYGWWLTACSGVLRDRWDVEAGWSDPPSVSFEVWRKHKWEVLSDG